MIEYLSFLFQLFIETRISGEIFVQRMMISLTFKRLKGRQKDLMHSLRIRSRTWDGVRHAPQVWRQLQNSMASKIHFQR